MKAAKGQTFVWISVALVLTIYGFRRTVTEITEINKFWPLCTPVKSVNLGARFALMG